MLTLIPLVILAVIVVALLAVIIWPQPARRYVGKLKRPG